MGYVDLIIAASIHIYAGFQYKALALRSIQLLSEIRDTPLRNYSCRKFRKFPQQEFGSYPELETETSRRATPTIVIAYCTHEKGEGGGIYDSHGLP